MTGGGENSSFQKGSNSSASAERKRATSSPEPEERIKRCKVIPYESEMKSILKHRTVDESLDCLSQSCPAIIGRRQASHNRGITFGIIVIREYARTLGDNPSCSSGPPVSISWEYEDIRKVSVEDFEHGRPARRTQMEMVLPRKQRTEMLKKDWNISQRQIADAVRQNVKIKTQRRTTVNNLGKASNLEQIMENLTRKVKRTILFQKSVSYQCKELEAKHNEAMRMKQRLRMEVQMADEDEEVKDSVVDENKSMDESPKISPLRKGGKIAPETTYE